MQPFVDVVLRQIPHTRNNADIEALLGYLAEHLGYRSAYLLEFPSDGSSPIRLWDSNAERAEWWLKVTNGGMTSISRSLAEVLARGGVQAMNVDPADPRYSVAVEYDFVYGTVVPITFEGESRGIACFCGEPGVPDDISTALLIVCYALLAQARTLGRRVIGDPSVYLTPRERQVVELSAQGMTSEVVAAQLSMSPRTVNQHLDNIADKLHTRNRVHTVAEAIRRGLLA